MVLMRKDVAQERMVEYIKKYGPTRKENLIRHFTGAPYSLGRGTVDKWLNIIVDEELVRTWYTHGRWYDDLLDDDKILTEIEIFIQKKYLGGIKVTDEFVCNTFIEHYGESNETWLRYLSILEQQNRARSWGNGIKQYGPPKFPLSIKFGIAASGIVMMLGMLLDMFMSSSAIRKIIYFGGDPIGPGKSPSILPMIIYIMIGIFLTTATWYFSTTYSAKKKVKLINKK